MKLLLITGSFPPMKCGVGDYSYRLVGALADDPHFKVAVLTSVAAADMAKLDGVEVFPVVKSWDLAEAPKVIKIIRAWKPDIVHIQYPTQGYGKGLLPGILPAMSFLLGTTIVQTWHEGYSRRNAPGLFLRSVAPSGLVVVRPGYKDKLHPLLRWALWNKKCVFIPNASTIPRIDVGEQEKHELRMRYLKSQQRLIVFFGFVYPHKGVDLLFEISNPESDAIVIAGEIGDGGEYFQKIKRRTLTPPWLGKVTITGFLPSGEVAGLLAAADAVILPFRDGGGEWNTSLHAAGLQGSFVITTSRDRNGYDSEHNVYYAKLNDVQEMRSALDGHAGTRREHSTDMVGGEWHRIAVQHRSLYETLLSK